MSVRRTLITLCLLFIVREIAPATAAEPIMRQRLGTFRFALPDLPPLLAPAAPTVAYLKNGHNANPYDDSLPPGSIVGIVERRPSTGSADSPAVMTTYELVLLTQGEFRHRAYIFEGEKFQVRLLFPGTALAGPGPKPTAAALRKAFGRHVVFDGDRR